MVNRSFHVPPMTNDTKNILIGVLLFCLAVAIVTIVIGP